MSGRAIKHGKSGFTLIETMIAITILMVGILGLAGVLAQGLAFMDVSEFEYIAQQKAAEAVESIFTARDQGQLTWTTICNVGDTSTCSGGIFLVGAKTLCDPGADGIIGTTDDYNGTACNVSTDSILQPGTNGTYATPVRIPLTVYNFQRTITITGVTGVPNLRQIQVVITYQAGHWGQQSYTLTTDISDFS
jgi:type II secretory pathway pseudopilin PulG